MTTQTTSRRADTGLPDVRNGFAFLDSTGDQSGFYFGDGFTWDEFAGSVLWQDPMVSDIWQDNDIRHPNMKAELKASRSSRQTLSGDGRPSFTVRTSKNGL